VPPQPSSRKVMSHMLMGAGVLRSDRSSLLLAVEQPRLVVVPTLSLAIPLREAHCISTTGC
jgi:hypothetical protein